MSRFASALGGAVKSRGSLLIVVLWCAGCGGPARHSELKPSPHGSPIGQAEATHEYPSPPVRQQTARGGSASAVAAVLAFASAYINWDAGTVAADMRRLARRSVAQARAAMQLAAAEVTSDYELRRGGIANRGTVEAIAPLRATPGRFVVVTHELTTATATAAYQGLQPAWHVAIATVTRQGQGRWVVSGWQPEN